MSRSNIRISWDLDPVKVLDGLRQSHKNQILRPVMRRVGKKARADVKAAAPRDTGAMKASIRAKVGTSRKGKTVYLIVGPDYRFTKTVSTGRGKARAIKRYSSGRRKGDAYMRRPAKYLHLVEGGHRGRQPRAAGLLSRLQKKLTRSLGIGKRVKGQPFLEPTLRRNWASYQQIIFAGCQMQYDKWLAKRLKAGKSV